MATSIRASASAAGTLLLCVLLTGASAHAQSVEPDEAVMPNGQVTQKAALSAVQESVIYNAAMRQRAKAPTAGFDAAVGAPVPAGVELRDLPGQDVPGPTDAADPWPATFLKYAMVEDKVVVVDPVAMRVVDVISDNSTRP